MEEILMLPPELTIRNVAGLRDELLVAIAKQAPGPLTVDATQVQEVDGAGVQLLIALRRSLAARRRGMALIGSPPVLQTALATFGVAPAATNGATS